MKMLAQFLARNKCSINITMEEKEGARKEGRKGNNIGAQQPWLYYFVDV